MSLTDIERHVYDLIARRFIAVFYPDCKFATTIVTGDVDGTAFKVSGKQILEQGWRAVYAKDKAMPTARGSSGDADGKDDIDGGKEVEVRTLPLFTKGESGGHKPTLAEKWTTPPKHYTEATLLRAMETAGRFVDDEELRAALKENGIGRPSSRAGIIETLFKRRYIRRERKQLIATATGIELIDTINIALLKSCELTGIWEKKLRDIESGKYDAQKFIDELKQQVADIVKTVKADTSGRRVTTLSDDDLKKKKATTKKSSRPSHSAGKVTKPLPKATTAATNAGDSIVGTPCPVCGKGIVIKGHTSYGCSRWREGCTFRQPFK